MSFVVKLESKVILIVDSDLHSLTATEAQSNIALTSTAMKRSTDYATHTSE